MSQGEGGKAAFGHKSAEIVVSAFFLALGALVMWDSVRLGARWASDGPEAGYFPFYVALLMSIASAVNLVMAVVKKGGFRAFVGRDQLKLVLSVLVPSILYVGVIAMLGIYVASTIFIAFFMRWLGKYAWWKVVVVSVVTMVVFFLIFESWFKVPLPKGKLEAWLGVD
jgi:putative tricarboxylic transport membrane protein